jgi:two-component system CheB/CheR fusion protein
VAAQPAQPGRFRAWSAGCAAGQEAYSIALLLARLESDGVASVQGFEVLGTDVDGDHLATARAGSYPGQAQAEIEVVVPNPRITVASDRIEIAPDLKDRVRFVREDLTDATRVDAVDLVLCRNVLIYFGDQGQESVLAALVRALRPGGLLMLGKAELAARSIPMIEPVDLRERIYRRVG